MEIHTTDYENLKRELDYLRRCSEIDAGKIMSLESQSLAIRHELEQKRRGLTLLAELAASMSNQKADHREAFLNVAKNLNAALNMQRTAVLLPNADGTFTPSVLQGYPPDKESGLLTRELTLADELLSPVNHTLVTGADSLSRLSTFRVIIGIPYFISVPVVLDAKLSAILITGRLVEEQPFLPRLAAGDVETVRMVASHLGAILANERVQETELRMRIMFETTPLCCNFWDENHNNIDCNQEAVRLFNLSTKQEYLERFLELSPEIQPNGERSEVLAHKRVTEAFETGYCKFPWMHQKLNGEKVPSEITLVRVKRRDKNIVVGYTRDLREQPMSL